MQAGAPQTPAWLPPPQMRPPEHPPQSTWPPHPSLAGPQASVPQTADAASGTQGQPPEPQRSRTPPPPQVSPPWQVTPQPVSKPPQPSLATPQLSGSTSAQVSGVHVGAPHWLCCPPPPQLSWPTEQTPHSTRPPQPLLMAPQAAPTSLQSSSAGQTSGLPEGEPQRLWTPLPPQVSPASVQVPHSIRRPQPSTTGPQSTFSSSQVLGVQF